MEWKAFSNIGEQEIQKANKKDVDFITKLYNFFK